MSHRKTACVFPSPSEIELGTIPGTEPGTALRVRVEPTMGEGYARIEQLAWSADLGWYTQKSFVVPAAMIKALVTELRKADCHIPKAKPDLHDSPLPFPGPDAPPHDQHDDDVRREA